MRKPWSEKNPKLSLSGSKCISWRKLGGRDQRHSVNVRNSGASLLCVHNSRLQWGVYKNQTPLKMGRTKTICPIYLFVLFEQTVTTKAIQFL